MSIGDPSTASFQITHESEPPETLVAGFSQFGLAGLTAVDYLIDHLDMEETGYITTDVLPMITPFENGTPRHHSRLFSRSDLDVTVLINELVIPVWAANSFAEAILEWTDANDVSEISVLAGVPIPHGPEEHRVFYVATTDYQTHRLGDVDIPPMGNGFLDGVNASLIGRGMDTSLRACVFVTPAHAQAPDVDAALRLIETFETVYGIDIDSGPLEKFAGEVHQYYQELADRLQTVEQEQLPEDRMYM